MHRYPTPHKWMYWHHHPSSKCTGILPLAHECTEIVTPQVNAPISYTSHMNPPKSSSLKQMNRDLIPHTWMHRHRHSSGKCTDILSLTHECTESHHLSSKCTGILPLTHECTANRHSSSKCNDILPLTHECTGNRHSSGKCTDILPLTHECTEIIIPQMHRNFTPHTWMKWKSSPLRKMDRYPTPHTWMRRNHHPSSKCTRILPLTHEWTEIVTPQVNAPESYPSYMNAPKSSFNKWMHWHLTLHTWRHRNHHPSSKCNKILALQTWMHRNRHPSSRCTEMQPLTHECTEIVIPSVKAPESYPTHTNARNRHSSGKCTEILHLTHECTEIIIPQVNAPESCPSHMHAPKWSVLR